jgi:RNA polymerase sigma factor (sigma-70 family)
MRAARRVHDWDTMRLTPEQQQLALSVVPFCFRRIAQFAPRIPRDRLTDLAYMAAVKAAATFDASKGCQPTTWATQYCLAALTDQRRDRSVKAVPLGGIIDDEGRGFAESTIPDPEGDATDAVDLGDESSHLWRQIRRHLDARSVTVLRMRFVEELSLQECADALKLCAGRVRQIQTRALQKLRERLTNPFEEEPVLNVSTFDERAADILAAGESPPPATPAPQPDAGRACTWCGAIYWSANPARQKCDACQARKVRPGSASAPRKPKPATPVPQQQAPAKPASKVEPAHYRDLSPEPIEVIERWQLDFCLGNALKYLARAGRKGGEAELDDLKKAAWYLQRRFKQLEREP